MQKKAILLAGLLLCSIPISAQGRGLDDAVSKILTICTSIDQSECIESLEYLSKDNPNGQFESLSYQAPLADWPSGVAFSTKGTNFRNSDGLTNLFLIVYVQIMKVSDATGWFVPGYLGNVNDPDASGIGENPNQIPIKEMTAAQTWLTIATDEATGDPGYSGNGRLRLGDRFRLVFRSGNLNPFSFETATRKFNFSTSNRNGYYVVSEEGEVGEKISNPSGAFSDVCYSSTSIGGAHPEWTVKAYQATPAQGYVLAPYKVTKQSDCPILLPSYAGNGQTQFQLSAPHFRPDGVTPVSGYFEVQMPLDYWPNLAKEGSELVSVSYGGEFTPIDATRTESDLEVKYVIEDFHFSAPKFAIGAEYSTSGKKGKSIKISKILKSVNFTASSKSRLSFKSLSATYCKISGSELKLLKSGLCTLQVEVKRQKPNPILVTGSVGLVDKKMSFVEVAKSLGAVVPSGSSLSVSVAKSSKSFCSVKSGKIVQIGRGICRVTLKAQPPEPPASKEQIKFLIS